MILNDCNATPYAIWLFWDTRCVEIKENRPILSAAKR